MDITDPADWPWFALAGAIALLGWWGGRWLARERQKEMAQAAKKRGWTYTARQDELARKFRGKAFRGADKERAEHVFRGSHRGREFVAFEYAYVIKGSTSNSFDRTTYKYLVCAVDTPSERPFLEVSEESLFRGISELFGAKDLQLESQRFNEIFKIDSEIDRFTYDVLHPRMMEWMLQDKRIQDWGFWLQGAQAVVAVRGEMNLDLVPEYLDYLNDIIDRIPDFVWTY